MFDPKEFNSVAVDPSPEEVTKGVDQVLSQLKLLNAADIESIVVCIGLKDHESSFSAFAGVIGDLRANTMALLMSAIKNLHMGDAVEAMFQVLRLLKTLRAASPQADKPTDSASIFKDALDTIRKAGGA